MLIFKYSVVGYLAEIRVPSFCKRITISKTFLPYFLLFGSPLENTPQRVPEVPP